MRTHSRPGAVLTTRDPPPGLVSTAVGSQEQRVGGRSARDQTLLPDAADRQARQFAQHTEELRVRLLKLLCLPLSLSTNCIDRLIPLSGMKKLGIRSLGRNQIKKIEKLDDVSDTLEELWISYNVIATLDGLSRLTNLTTLYLSNSLIKSWDELDKLANLPKLRDMLFVGNPIYENMSKEEQRLNVLKRITKVAKIDGDMVKQTERDGAMGQ